ncbi:MAG: hypothetical protein N3G22_00075 [Candidatus Micrarchaeota archaeon]|nr:hypothetical protein [Candidatus Micrarchaeota archaeon]
MLPCAEVHWKILPAVCRELALCMRKKGMAQTKIAMLIGSTPAAVSQYISGRRGGGRLSARAKKECKKLAGKIASGKVEKEKIDIEMARIVAIEKISRNGGAAPCRICAAPLG